MTTQGVYSEDLTVTSLITFGWQIELLFAFDRFEWKFDWSLPTRIELKSTPLFTNKNLRYRAYCLLLFETELYHAKRILKSVLMGLNGKWDSPISGLRNGIWITGTGIWPLEKGFIFSSAIKNHFKSPFFNG